MNRRIRLRATSVVHRSATEAVIVAPTRIVRFRGGAGTALADRLGTGGWVEVTSAVADSLIEVGACTTAPRPDIDEFPAHVARQVGYLEALTADGADAQRRIAALRVAILGVGGIGANLAMLLAGAGVGHLRLIDFDEVAHHNLNRQLTFVQSDVGQSKVHVVRDRLRALAPAVDVVVGTERVDRCNVVAALRPTELDVLVVAADEPPDIMDVVIEGVHDSGAVVVRGAVGYETGYVGPFFGPEASCWSCFERARLADVDADQRGLADLEGTPGRWSFGPTNMLIASVLAHEVLLRAVRGISSLDAQRVIFRADPFQLAQVASPTCGCGAKERER